MVHRGGGASADALRHGLRPISLSVWNPAVLRLWPMPPITLGLIHTPPVYAS